MGYCILPAESEAAAMARASYAKDKLSKVRRAECEADLIESWRALAAEPCALCSKPIGWDTKYYFGDRPGTLEHAVCAWNREQ